MSMENKEKEFIDDTSAQVFVVLFFPANDTSTSQGFTWFHDYDTALTHYENTVRNHGDDAVVRMIECNQNIPISYSDEEINELLTMPEIVEQLEIFSSALHNHVPDSIDAVRRIPLECIYDGTAAALYKKPGTLEKLIRCRIDDEKDVQVLSREVRTVMDCCDNFVEIHNYDDEQLSYVRGLNQRAIQTVSEKNRKHAENALFTIIFDCTMYDEETVEKLL